MRRAFDISAAAAALLVTSPLLLGAIIWIVIESPGSPFFRQRRVGKDNQDFMLVKLRTMVKNAESKGAGLAVDENDSRILKSGALLRRLSIDELPNLINVLKGEMSIIGPRPTVRAQVDKYNAHQLRRLEVKPGITGWAQVNGRAALPWSERIDLDVWYVDHRSAKLDAQILLKTAKLLFSGDDVYRGETGGWK
ncbi:MAG: sugar transferase [Thermoleophilaceae bacterium]|nr:sugar transferase [Thermoleophilaceae bacterium]